MDINGRPLVVAYGVGVDSTAMLVGLKQRGIRPDKITFADVGGEKEETYAYLGVIAPWLEFASFPPVTIVRYVPKRFKHWPPYYTLEENCLTNGTLPSISFGFSSCSMKWKQAPQHAHIKTWQPALEAWARGQKVVKAIGYDCSARDKERSAKSERLVTTYKDQDGEFYDYWYALQEFGWDRDQCKREIASEGLPVPEKSSCFFCLAMKPDEVAALPPDKLRRIVLMEARARPRLDKVEGLWRKSTKKKPGSMTQFISDQNLLPAEEVARIMRVPAELVAHQERVRNLAERESLGVFLHELLPEMYPQPAERELIQIELEPLQPSLFGEPQFCDEDVA